MEKWVSEQIASAKKNYRLWSKRNEIREAWILKPKQDFISADLFAELLVHSQESDRPSVAERVHVALRVEPVADVERLHLADDRVLFGGRDGGGHFVADVGAGFEVRRAEDSASSGVGQLLVQERQGL